MDKVIIDGVDISKCKYLHKSDKNYCYMSQYSDYCEAYTDCYFKQLKRLQAENEELKKELEKHKSKIGHLLSPLTDSDFQNKLKELEQESERLKEENKELKSSLVSQASIIFTLEKSSNDLSQCANKLYKALQEIRDIADENKDTAQYRGICLSILDKINEIGVE